MRRAWVASVLVVAAPAARVRAQLAPPPLFVAANQIRSPWTPSGVNAVPDVPVLSSAERRALEQAIAALPKFPSYLYSGCHDRAHAAYLLLPDAVRRKAAKIWVFSPSKLTPTLYGTIGLRAAATDSAAARVAWGYHVALAFGRGDSLLVFDAALAADRVLTRDEWFGRMIIPPLSIWTLLDGSTYSFSGVVPDTTKGPRSPNGPAFAGAVFGYTGPSQSQGWIPQNLARDAVGEAILARGACPALRPRVTDSGDLLEMMQSGQAPAGCAAVVTLFQREVARWKGLLPAGS